MAEIQGGGKNQGLQEHKAEFALNDKKERNCKRQKSPRDQSTPQRIRESRQLTAGKSPTSPLPKQLTQTVSSYRK